MLRFRLAIKSNTRRALCRVGLGACIVLSIGMWIFSTSHYAIGPCSYPPLKEKGEAITFMLWDGELYYATPSIIWMHMSSCLGSRPPGIYAGQPSFADDYDSVEQVWPEYGFQWHGIFLARPAGRVPLWLLVFLLSGALLSSFVSVHRARPGTCRACGYDLRGNNSFRCPECGLTFEPSSRVGGS